MTRPVMVALHHDTAPDRTEPTGAQTWLTRGANFVVAVSRVDRGQELVREMTPDESMVYLYDVPARIEADGETIDAEADTLTIVPPGPSRVVAMDAGVIVRVFSTAASDLAKAAANADAYAGGGHCAAPLVYGPDPIGGFRLRTYRLADHVVPGSNMRVFRSTNLMINPLARRAVTRDVTALSPHSHEDFEQASLVLEGRYIHHARYPWGADLTQWRDDEAIEAGAPSVAIIPPRVIHTSRNVDGPGYLVDIFAPPRADFERRGIVCNASDYPAPLQEANQ